MDKKQHKNRRYRAVCPVARAQRENLILAAGEAQMRRNLRAAGFDAKDAIEFCFTAWAQWGDRWSREKDGTPYILAARPEPKGDRNAPN